MPKRKGDNGDRWLANERSKKKKRQVKRKEKQAERDVDGLIQQAFGKFVSDPRRRNHYFATLKVFKRSTRRLYVRTLLVRFETVDLEARAIIFKPIHHTFDRNNLPSETTFRYEWVPANRGCFEWVLKGPKHIPNTNLHVISGMDWDDLQSTVSKWLCENIDAIERLLLVHLPKVLVHFLVSFFHY